MIRFADESMIHELKALWLECFPGDDDYCAFFFDRYFTGDTCVVHTNDGGEVEAAAYIFRGEVTVAGKRESVYFLYAGATFKKYRKMGKCSAICRWIADYCRENGVGIISLSTSPSSLSLCEKSGMVPMVSMRATVTAVSELAGALSCEDCGYEEFAAMRRRFLAGEFEIDWTADTLRYMYDEMHVGGGIVKISIGGRDCYAAYTCLEDGLLIRETDCPADNMDALVRAVAAHIGYTGKVTLYTKPDIIPRLSVTASQEEFCYAHLWFVDESLNAPDAGWYINLTAE
ncbi:MAG: GNAT family N-acetyltransferase [Ruminococcaceae bacterium]|nr:GNAT family N-acetyltransferase [Oscillospiraceae bacterium]